MANPDPWKGHLSWDEVTKMRREHVVFEWYEIIQQYLQIVLGEGEPLRFSLMAGQPIYDATCSEIHVLDDSHPPLDVYLDAARIEAFDPFEMLIVGTMFDETPLLLTFLLRIDYACQPDFDSKNFHRVRMEHVLRNIRASCPEHYVRLKLIYQFRRRCQELLPSRRYRVPLLEEAYAFLQGHPYP